MEEALAELQAKGLVTESQGALVVDLSAYDMPPFLLKKQDGTTLYSTRDLATALYRQRTWGFDTCLYVVDTGQSLHFAQVFKVLELAGFAWTHACHHIPFGLVLTKNPASTPRREISGALIHLFMAQPSFDARSTAATMRL